MNPQILKTDQAFTCSPSKLNMQRLAWCPWHPSGTHPSPSNICRKLKIFSWPSPENRGRGRRYSPPLAVSVRACARQSHTARLYSLTDVQGSHRKQILRKDISITSLQFLLDGDVFKVETYSSTWDFFFLF